MIMVDKSAGKNNILSVQVFSSRPFDLVGELPLQIDELFQMKI